MTSVYCRWGGPGALGAGFEGSLLTEAEKLDLLLRAAERGISMERVYRLLIVRAHARNCSGSPVSRPISRYSIGTP